MLSIRRNPLWCMRCGREFAPLQSLRHFCRKAPNFDWLFGEGFTARLNSSPACQRVETAEEACQRLAERDKVSLGTSLHREQHDGASDGQEGVET